MWVIITKSAATSRLLYRPFRPASCRQRHSEGAHPRLRRKVSVSLAAGVLAKAQLNWPTVKLYGYAFMSNHIHLMLQGTSFDFPAFMGFSSASSRRLGQKLSDYQEHWHQRYKVMSAPPPMRANLCLKYVLAQGVKDIPARPTDRPGSIVQRHY